MAGSRGLARKFVWLPVMLAAFFGGKQAAAWLWSPDARDAPADSGTAGPGEPAAGGVDLASFEERFLGDGTRDRGQVMAARTWAEFYEAMEVVDVPPDEAEKLVLARVGRVLELSPAQQVELVRLFRDEQDMVTEAAIGRHGRERLYSVLDLPKSERRAFMEELRREREEVRRTFDEAYAELVGPNRLVELDEHLRSERIVLVRSKNDQSVAIGGVGYPDSH